MKNLYSKCLMDEPINYRSPVAEDHSYLRGRNTAIVTRWAGCLLVLVAGFYLLCFLDGLQSQPWWLGTMVFSGCIGVVVTAVGLIKLRLSPPYPIEWTNAGVSLLWTFFWWHEYRIGADILSDPRGALWDLMHHWSPGEMVELLPEALLILATCLVIRIDFINRRYRR